MEGLVHRQEVAKASIPIFGFELFGWLVIDASTCDMFQFKIPTHIRCQGP